MFPVPPGYSDKLPPVGESRGPGNVNMGIFLSAAQQLSQIQVPPGTSAAYLLNRLQAEANNVGLGRTPDGSSVVDSLGDSQAGTFLTEMLNDMLVDAIKGVPSPSGGTLTQGLFNEIIGTFEGACFCPSANFYNTLMGSTVGAFYTAYQTAIASALPLSPTDQTAVVEINAEIAAHLTCTPTDIAMGNIFYDAVMDNLSDVQKASPGLQRGLMVLSCQEANIAITESGVAQDVSTDSQVGIILNAITTWVNHPNQLPQKFQPLSTLVPIYNTMQILIQDDYADYATLVSATGGSMDQGAPPQADSGFWRLPS